VNWDFGQFELRCWGCRGDFRSLWAGVFDYLKEHKLEKENGNETCSDLALKGDRTRLGNLSSWKTIFAWNKGSVLVLSNCKNSLI